MLNVTSLKKNSENIKNYIAKEITDASFGRINELPITNDYKNQFDNLTIQKLYLASDALVLTLQAKKYLRMHLLYFKLIYLTMKLMNATLSNKII